MRRYKIIEATTNLGKTFYRIEYKVSILFGLISYWESDDYEDSSDPIEYNSIEQAKKQIAIYEENRAIRNEHIVTETEIETI